MSRALRRPRAPQPKLRLTMSETMHALSCSRVEVLALQRAGYIVGSKNGRSQQAQWRFSAKSVREFAENPPAKVDFLARSRPRRGGV